MPIRLNDATLAPAVRSFLDTADTSPNDNLLTKEEAIQQWGSLKDFQQQLAGRFNLFADFDKGKVTAIFRKPFETEAVVTVGGIGTLLYYADFEELLEKVKNFTEDRSKLSTTPLVQTLVALIHEIATPTEEAKIVEAARELSDTYLRQGATEAVQRLELQISKIQGLNNQSVLSRAGIRTLIFASMVRQMLKERIIGMHGGGLAHLRRRAEAAEVVLKEISKDPHNLTASGLLDSQRIRQRFDPVATQGGLDAVVQYAQEEFGTEKLRRSGVVEILKYAETADDLEEALMQRAISATGDAHLSEDTIKDIAAERRRLADNEGMRRHEVITHRVVTCIDLIAEWTDGYGEGLPNAVTAETAQAIRLVHERRQDPTAVALREKYASERLFFERFLPH